MSDTPAPPDASSLQGRIFRPNSPTELAEAIELAFDYRGDITLELSSGETLEGYIFNRSSSGSTPSLQLFPKDQSAEQNIPYAGIVSIAFTGEDTASGKSWEAWVSKKESQRMAEAEQAASEAKARGHL